MLRKIIAIPDIQAPKHDERAVSVALKIVKGEKPDILIHIGDLVDLLPASKYRKNKWRENLRTVSGDLASANGILDRFDKTTPRKTETIYIEGNHEERLESFFVNKVPELGPDFKGITIREQLKLDERGYKYIIREKQPLYFGKVGFSHGLYCNPYHASKTSTRFRRNIVYGHTHDLQIHSGFHLYDEAPNTAMSIGCLCDFQQDYMKSGPINWVHGVGLFYLDDESGRFWPYFATIINGEAVINGKRYKA